MKRFRKAITIRLNRLKDRFKPFPRLESKRKLRGKKELLHISAFSYGNAGDTLLPVVLRDLFNQKTDVGKWKSIHVYKVVNDKIIKTINGSDTMVIGGGGLFLRDTNPNDVSGWQWPCSIDSLDKITKPIIMFAVGYNRFRGQADFDPVFTDNLNRFVEKAAFVGIRNNGSIDRLKGYLRTEDLKQKLVFQPCMTTLISKIYPKYYNWVNKEDFIAINCAFDRQELRKNDDSILNSIANVVSDLSKITKIKYYSHMLSDELILPYFDEKGINYELVRFKDVKQIVKSYASPRLVIGMRGHAQMIPFGCNTPILSIVSHDKMQWFLNDINHPEWGADVLDPEFETKLLEQAVYLYNNSQNMIKLIQDEQEKLWSITCNNMDKIKNIVE